MNQAACNDACFMFPLFIVIVILASCSLLTPFLTLPQDHAAVQKFKHITIDDRTQHNEQRIFCGPHSLNP